MSHRILRNTPDLKLNVDRRYAPVPAASTAAGASLCSFKRGGPRQSFHLPPLLSFFADKHVRNAFNPQHLIYHLTNNQGCGIH
jgi:hypothetical protein